MALLEKVFVDSINVTELNVIEVRIASAIFKDDQEISRNFHRHSLAPIDDITNEDPKVKAIANVIWTKEVIDNYKVYLESIAKK